MLAGISSLLGGRAGQTGQSSTGSQQAPTPPPVTVTGVRIPVDGSPAHLLPLTTTPSIEKVDRAWRLRDKVRLDFLPDQHVPRSMHLEQQAVLRRALLGLPPMDEREGLHVRQRYCSPKKYFILQPEQRQCAGAYYAFYSFALDDLVQNMGVAGWIVNASDGPFFGNAFLMKLVPQEKDEDGSAVYEDVGPEFLEVLACGPVEGVATCRPPSWPERDVSHRRHSIEPVQELCYTRCAP
ncbi:hypothetical protein B0T14DRAFT_568141 [Immersiella caudata]|uniref:Uncharacterized protein n=1 Tax=Immersiella caudata TaxID=314043 RepID=A0AA39WJI6_9PEZI|nr:hypothetical protein B0T14DRAFT_568141 [Immersiella caudata]